MIQTPMMMNHRNTDTTRSSGPINIVKSDTSLKEEMKDFHAWIMANQPDTFGPDKRDTVFTKDEIKPLKKTHNFKELKNDPSAPWFEFITNNA